MSNMFKKGYEPVKEEKKRQDKAREAAGNQLWQFFIKSDGEEAKVRFLTEEPISFNAHVVQNGKAYDTVVCPGDDCDLCDEGNKTSFKGAFLIVDKRPVELKDKKTGKKKKIKAQLRLYIQGARVLSQLDRYSSKYGLTSRDYTIARTGSGQDTTYSFDPEDKSRMSKEEIKNLLPEKLRDVYDGTMESLYAIVEDQLLLMLGGSSEYSDDEDDEDEDDTSYAELSDDDDDDDEDDYEIEEDDDEEEDPEPPKRKNKPGLKASFKSSKKPKRK